MTVAYEAGVASSPSDLLTKLTAFAASNGWTVSSVTGGAVFRNGDINVGVNATSPDLFLRGALGFDSGAAWNAQPGSAAHNVRTNLGAGPFTAYHAFVGEEDGFEHVHCAVEISAGLWRHLTFGRLFSYGALVGGVYVDGVYWASGATNPNLLADPANRFIAKVNGANVTSTTNGFGQVWCDYDGKENNWQYNQVQGSVPLADRVFGSVANNAMYMGLVLAAEMKWNLRTPLWPVEYSLGRPEGLRTVAGRIPNMRQVSLRNYAPGDEIAIGGETWKVFPIIRRTTATPPNSEPNSDLYGYAYRMPDA